MSDTTPSLIETPPHADEGCKFTDEAAWDKWTENGAANVAWHIGWSGGGYGYDTEAEVKEAWAACPGDNWLEAEYCDDAQRILQDEGKEVHGANTYRSVLINSFMTGPDRTMDGWNLVGSCSAGSTCEVQVDNEGTMRYVDIEGTINVYECPTEFEVVITQCTSDHLSRGADARVGEVLISTGIDGTSTVQDVLDGLEASLAQVDDLPTGSSEYAAYAACEVISSHLGIEWSEEDGCFQNDDDLEKIWDSSLEEDNGEGPNVYLYIKPA